MNSNEFCFWFGGVVAATDREKPNDAQWAKILARLDSLGAEIIPRRSASGDFTVFAGGGGGRPGGNISKSSSGGNGSTAYCGAPPSGLPG